MADTDPLVELIAQAHEARHMRRLAHRRLAITVQFYTSLEALMATATQQIMDALDKLDVSEQAEQDVVQAAITLLKAKPTEEQMQQILTRIGARAAAADAETADVQGALGTTAGGATGGATGSDVGGAGAAVGDGTVSTTDTGSDSTSTTSASSFNPNAPSRNS